MTAYQNHQTKVENTFTDLVTLSALRSKALSDAPENSRDELQRTSNSFYDSIDRVTAFASDYLAHEVKKREGDRHAILTDDVQERFDEVEAIIERHVQPGEDRAQLRYAMLSTAEEWAQFSPHHAAGSSVDCYSQLRDDLNSKSIGNPVTYLLNREQGVRNNTANLGVQSQLFTDKSAEEFSDSLGHLHQVLVDRVGARDNVFVNSELPSHGANLPAEIAVLEERISSSGPYPTFGRVARAHAIRDREFERIVGERIEEALSGDTFSPPRREGSLQVLFENQIRFVDLKTEFAARENAEGTEQQGTKAAHEANAEVDDERSSKRQRTGGAGQLYDAMYDDAARSPSQRDSL